ncbi:hypothetical protein ACFQ93_36005 [Streptomyces sp. NPDC056601]|uniref:hypothetical protein n=1 Tax=Streptomyces sp. NPDC056601 TaxID=3345875 RepID=UPI0036B59B06
MEEDEDSREFDARGGQGQQFGDHNFQVNNFRAAQPAARSAYLFQVQAIAPEELRDRVEELAALADFCTRTEGGDYLWWHGKAWAGKSALLSWFVLHPPPRTRIVSFFITGRFAGQSDREAFLDVVIEQLAALLGESVPSMTSSTRAAHMWALLDRAATARSDLSERLVLVVDGLDEDASAEHSIAALLPTRPPAGMRVIVAGRSDRPLPDGVPDGHPLRDSAVQRYLPPSPYAQGIRREAERELKRLLRGTAGERDLLGLLTAAGGGLSGADLAHLTGRQSWEIEDVLHAVAGRTFASRPAPSLAASVANVYVLGHEELQRTAARFLDGSHLKEYRLRLHDWADEYRRKRWPTDTPAYLLRGYFRMLHATSDLPRMIECGLDKSRHDRMLDVSGGDAAALNEIATAQDALLEHDDLDLQAMAFLALHRDTLGNRNTNIPYDLPAVWALLGQKQRAEALALSFPGPVDKVLALSALIEAMAESGDHDRACDLAAVAAAATRSITDSEHRARALADVARALATAGNADRAEAIARNIDDSDERARALADVARALATAGNADRAEAIARNIDDSDERARALADVARALATAGNADRAEAIARNIDDPPYGRELAQALADVAVAVAQLGDVDQAKALASEAEAIARRIVWPDRGEGLLGSVAHAVAWAGDIDQAEAIARNMEDPLWRWAALAHVTQAVAAVGDTGRAEAIAQSIDSPSHRARAMVNAAHLLAWGGDVDRAEAIARNIDDPGQRTWALANVARMGGPVGDHPNWVKAFASEAEAITQSIYRPDSSAKNVADVALAAARAEYANRAEAFFDEAEAIARSNADPHERAQALTTVALMAARAPDPERANTLVSEALETAWNNADPHEQAKDLTKVALAAAQAGFADRAKALASQAAASARKIVYLATQANALGEVAQAVARLGESDRAKALASEAEAAARSNARRFEAHYRANALTDLLLSVAGAADPNRVKSIASEAEASARSITEPHDRARALVDLARAWARAADSEHAEGIARSIDVMYESAHALAEVALTVAEVGDTERAKALASEAEVIVREGIRRAPNTHFWRVGAAAHAVARALACMGDVDRAKALAQSIGIPRDWAPALADVALAVAETGDADRAQAIACSITHPHEQARALARVARTVAPTVAAAGDADRAEAIARRIADPHEQARALAGVALAVAVARETEGAESLVFEVRARAGSIAEPGAARACLLLGHALRLGPYQAACEALAVIRPDVLAAVADDLLART